MALLITEADKPCLVHAEMCYILDVFVVDNAAFRTELLQLPVKPY